MEQITPAEFFIRVADVLPGGFAVGLKEVFGPEQAAEIFFTIFVDLDPGIFFFIDPLSNDLICNDNLRSGRAETDEKKYCKKYFMHSCNVRRVNFPWYQALKNIQVKNFLNFTVLTVAKVKTVFWLCNSINLSMVLYLTMIDCVLNTVRFCCFVLLAC